MTNSTPIDAQNVAFVFEGGGPRAVYTAPVVQALIEHNVQPGWVGGISAGTTHTINFLTGDIDRCHTAFVDLYSSPIKPGIKPLLKGRGFFNTQEIFHTACESGGLIEVDYASLENSPAQYRIGAFCAENGEMTYWQKSDQHRLSELLNQCQASCSLPVLMPMATVDGQKYIDGAFGQTAGIAIDAAEADGFEKMVVVMTRPRDYVRPPVKRPGLFNWLYRKFPKAASAVIGRPDNYNRVKQQLFEWEKEGKVFLYFPDEASLKNTETNPEVLEDAFKAGFAQIERDWDSLEAFLKAN